MTDNPYYNKVEAWRVSVSGSVSVAETACLVGTLGMGLHLTPRSASVKWPIWAGEGTNNFDVNLVSIRLLCYAQSVSMILKLENYVVAIAWPPLIGTLINVTWVTSTFNWHVFSNDLSTSFILQCCHEHWKPWWPRRLPKVSFSAWVCLIWEKWAKTPRSYRH